MKARTAARIATSPIELVFRLTGALLTLGMSEAFLAWRRGVKRRHAERLAAIES